MDKINVSVIIPIWGVEKYIERCARSLFNQTMDSIEFIFVDDCTPDKSIEILEKVIEDYPRRKNNIHIIHHKENKGLPQARQTGLGMAKGNYIAHCDSDDWVDIDLYEKMYRKVVDNDADIAVCSFIETDLQHISKELPLFPCVNNGIITNKLTCWENEGSLCNKLFKQNLYTEDIVVPTGNMGEDMCMVYQLIFQSKKTVIVTNAHYYIFKNPSSITRTPTQSNIYKIFLQAYENCRIVEDFYISHKAVDSDTKKAILRLKYSKREILRPVVGIKKYHKIWCGTFPEIDRTFFKDNGLTFREKLKSLLIRFHIFPLPWRKCKMKE